MLTFNDAKPIIQQNVIQNDFSHDTVLFGGYWLTPIPILESGNPRRSHPNLIRSSRCSVLSRSVIGQLFCFLGSTITSWPVCRADFIKYPLSVQVIEHNVPNLTINLSHMCHSTLIHLFGLYLQFLHIFVHGISAKLLSMPQNIWD